MDYHITSAQMTAFIFLAVWELFWKGLALWRAGRLNQVGWFVAILVINTMGVLPIIYLIISNDRMRTVKAKEAKS